MLSPLDQTNFANIKAAVINKKIALMECQTLSEEKYVAVIAFLVEHHQQMHLVPVAKMFEGNPYEEIVFKGENVLSTSTVNAIDVRLEHANDSIALLLEALQKEGSKWSKEKPTSLLFSNIREMLHKMEKLIEEKK